MAMFVSVQVIAEATFQPELVRKLVEVCPVDIFAQEQDRGLRVVEDNVDECVLCDLCIQAAPEGTVRVVKLYEEA